MKKIKKRRKKGIFILFLALFIAIFTALYSFSNKMLIGIGEASYQGVLSTASYYAIEKSLTKNFNYDKLYTVHKNNDNEISMITADAYKFNSLTTTLANHVGEYLTNYINSGVDVPLGVFTGIKLLQGFGKPIKMKLIAINSVKCDVVSKFESAGVNQTRHTLYLNVTPDISVVTRVSTKNVSDKITVMLYDNLIIGKVPEVYLSGTVFSAQKLY
ncbi:MAG: sporulation protein YunB [Clostridia bacterium]|nr:sporulation protein YunB [Clostridia bacterium]